MKSITFILGLTTLVAGLSLKPGLVSAINISNVKQASQQSTAQDSKDKKPPQKREQEQQQPKQQNPAAGKPPQAAIDICLNKPAKTQCEFQSPKGLEAGFCEATPDKLFFACNPQRGKQ